MQRDEGGFTLIETILGLVVMTLMVVAISNLVVSNLQALNLGKARALASAAANEQMEYLRDLPYDVVKTVRGPIYPAGTIQDTQVVTRGNYPLEVTTDIRYVDDPYDGNAAGTISGKPKDLNPADYKRAQIVVRLKTTGKLLAELTSDIAGKAAETASNTGIISVQVVDADGDPVNEASVRIYNPAQSPVVDITTTTDNQGYVVIPNLPPDSNNRYQITATKGGYSTDLTYADPAGTQTAAQPHLNVIAQNTQSLTLAIDRTGTLNLRVTDTTGAPVAGKAFTISGAKLKYRNPDAARYAAASPATDGGGATTITGLEWDSYSFAPPAGLYLVSAAPYAPAALTPGGSLTVNLVVSASASYPTIAKLTPARIPAGSATQLTFTGTNLPTGTTVRLRQSGQTDITATAVTSSNANKTLKATVTPPAGASGSWDVVVVAGGGTAVQPGGVDVTP